MGKPPVAEGTRGRLWTDNQSLPLARGGMMRKQDEERVRSKLDGCFVDGQMDLDGRLLSREEVENERSRLAPRRERPLSPPTEESLGTEPLWQDPTSF